MRVTEVRLKNFKRFTDLKIKNIPVTAKLVLVVGPNGGGKSSLFDAFINWYRGPVGFGYDGDTDYFQKSKEEEFEWRESVSLSIAGDPPIKKGSLYVRSAYRNDPDFSISNISRLNAPTEELRLSKVINNDQTVSINYQRLIYDTIAGVYNEANDPKTVQQLREELIGAVRRSMKEVFGDLVLNNVSDPLGAGAFYFEKGTSKAFHYKNLSGGEKAAFDLLLDMHIQRKFYTDAIYCIDEIETHLHTRIQGRLLKEMVSLLPGESQMWVTTHALGVMRAAQDMAASRAESVCIIDFDAVDADVPREIVPSNLDRLTWEKMLSLALDDLTPRVAPRILVVCEGSSVGSRRKDFDAEIYNRVLGSATHDIVFVSGGASGQVAASGAAIEKTLSTILPDTLVVPLCDRDDKSEQEVAEFEKAGGVVLTQRNLETLLFADDVIEALVNSIGKPELLDDALAIKKTALENSVIKRSNAPDDVKSAAGEIYVELKKKLALTRVGNSTEFFMRDTLAPLIKPPMKTYHEMKAAILDKVQARSVS